MNPIVQRNVGFGAGDGTPMGAGGCIHFWSTSRGIRTRIKESRCEPGLFDHKISEGSIVREAFQIEHAIYLPAAGRIEPRRQVILTPAGCIQATGIDGMSSLQQTGIIESSAWLIGAAIDEATPGGLVAVTLIAPPFRIEAAGAIALADCLGRDNEGRAVTVARPSVQWAHPIIAISSVGADGLVQAIHL